MNKRWIVIFCLLLLLCGCQKKEEVKPSKGCDLSEECETYTETESFSDFKEAYESLNNTENKAGKPYRTVAISQDHPFQETTAKNIMNARIPDNAGFQPRELPIRKGCPAALYSTLPLEMILEVLTALGIPCEMSGDAGEFVCNTLFYRMLHHASRKIPTGFIHVPYIREQGHTDQPFMELEDEYRAVAAAIETVSRMVGH